MGGMSEAEFDELAEVYEAMIDWPRRLATESPFFRGVFESCGARRVADVACGTGRHAAMFHSWGLEVEGSDLSAEMIRRARQEHGEPAGLSWAVRGFDEPVGPPGSFDAVVCVGNSLALAADREAAVQALRQMLGATRPGGVVVVHVLNLWKLPAGVCVWQRCVRKALSRGPSLVIKGVHRCDDVGYVELLVVAEGGEGAAALVSRSMRFLGLRASDLEAAARGAGAREVALYGGHQEQAYEPAASTDLIVVARKGAGLRERGDRRIGAASYNQRSHGPQAPAQP
jgi:SAM-dependent methyltransferase